METTDRKRANGNRLCRLLIDEGTVALRNVFDKFHTSTSWNSTLKSYGRSTMKKMIRNLNSAQLDILFPPNGDPSSSQNYDITLLFVLLRNFCRLSSPVSTGSWDKLPSSYDESMEGDLARIKFYRNKIYGHITTTCVNNNEFEQYWKEISDALIRLGIDVGAITRLKVAPLEEDLFVEKLKEWKENDDKLETQLQGISYEQARNQATNEHWFCLITTLIIILISFIFWNFTMNSESDQPKLNPAPSMRQLMNINSSRFFGRRWLFHELEDRINSSHDIRGILIVGEPGLGKSSIMRQLIVTPESSYFINRNIISHHFCKFDEKRTRNVGLFVKNIVRQFEKTIPEMAGFLKNDKSVENELENCENNPHSCFQMALLSSLQSLKKPPSVAFILIDALDECRDINDDSNDSPILQILHSKGTYFPKWIKFLFSSRNITTVIGKLSDIDVSTLHLRSTDKRNLQDVRSFIEKSLQSNPELIAKESGLHHSVEILSRLTQGNFLFITTILDLLQEHPESLYKENVLTTGTLGRLYALSFRERYKISDFEQMQPMLEVLLASGTPLKVKELENIFASKSNVYDASDYVKKAITQISPYLLHSDDGTVRFFHQSFSDWLMNQTEGIKGLFIQKSKGHRLIAEYLLNTFDNVYNKPTLKQFSELSLHTMNAGMIKEHIDKMLTFNVSQIREHYSNKTILHELAEVKGSTRILEVYVKEFEWVDIMDESGSPPSFYATQAGNIDNLKLFITNGADVNYVNDRYAVLLPNQVNPTAIDYPNRETSLASIVSELGDTKMAEILLHSGANFQVENTFGQKPIHIAAKYGNIELVQLFISYGINVDNIALHHAAARNYTEIVEYLLKTGNVRDTCLPCRPGNISSCYTSRNISINQTHLCFCETALHVAVARGYTEIVKLLLNYGHE